MDPLSIYEGRELPNSSEAEQTVLGAMLDEPSLIPMVIGMIKPECFYQENHKKLFGIIVRLFVVGKEIDYVVLINEALNEGVFQSETSAKTYLTGIMESVPSVSEDNIRSYCEIIDGLYQRRMLIEAAEEILKAAEEILTSSYDGTAAPDILLDSAEQKIYNIRQGKLSDGMAKIDSLMVPVFDRIVKLSKKDSGDGAGMKTGFGKLDSIMIGLNDTDLIIVAARPGMGKSAFALNVAANVCRSENAKSVCYFSLEMGNEQLVTRMLSSESLVNGYSLRSGDLKSEDWQKLARGADELASMPLYFDETAGITVSQMKAKVRRIPNCGLVIIDYLQLMSSPNNYNNRVLEISEITRQLKLMAKELKIPIILLSQLNRSVESRTDKHPQLADLRESGSIEQDADVILFLYREGYYNKELSDQSTSECIIAKNRHGETGTVKLAFVGEYTLFRDLEYHREEDA